AHQVLEATQGHAGVRFFGINQRGSYVAEQLATALGSLLGKEVYASTIDVDYGQGQARFAEEAVPDLSAHPVVLVDDVIFSGLTMLSALNLVMQSGLPPVLLTAALVDRGHR
ncbi:phosphoribosyltransferase family protein, partial [Arthrospira platensis SPKY1]|nr:phosphoribosyltransferase family protein [Arthrospira platensis SPKY1]